MFALAPLPFDIATAPCHYHWGQEDSFQYFAFAGAAAAGAVVVARIAIVAAGDGLGRALVACRKPFHCWGLQEASVARCR